MRRHCAGRRATRRRPASATSPAHLSTKLKSGLNAFLLGCHLAIRVADGDIDRADLALATAFVMLLAFVPAAACPAFIFADIVAVTAFWHMARQLFVRILIGAAACTPIWAVLGFLARNVIRHQNRRHFAASLSRNGNAVRSGHSGRSSEYMLRRSFRLCREKPLKEKLTCKGSRWNATNKRSNHQRIDDGTATHTGCANAV